MTSSSTATADPAVLATAGEADRRTRGWPAWTGCAAMSAASSTTTASRTSHRPPVEAVTDGYGVPAPGPGISTRSRCSLTAADWDVLRIRAGAALSRLLDAVLTDLYGPRRAITDGVLPISRSCCSPTLVTSGPLAVSRSRAPSAVHARLRRQPGGRPVQGQRQRLDPGAVGLGYALADRFLVAHTIPDVHSASVRVRRHRSPRRCAPPLIEAAPEAAEIPVVVVLSPGSHSETAFDQAYLASLLGPAGGERRPGGARRQAVDAVAGHLQTRRRGAAPGRRRIRRPARSARRLPAGCRRPGRGTAPRAVTVVNTLAAASWKALAGPVPAGTGRPAARENPLLGTRMYWGGIDAERSHLLARLDALLIRSTVGAARSSGRCCRRASAPSWRPGSRQRRGSSSVRNCRSSPRRRPTTTRQAELGQRRDAAVHGVPARRLRADDRRPGLRARARERTRLAETIAAKDVWVPPLCPRQGIVVPPPVEPPMTIAASGTAESVRRACCPTCSGRAATPSAPRAWPA